MDPLLLGTVFPDLALLISGLSLPSLTSLTPVSFLDLPLPGDARVLVSDCIPSHLLNSH